MIVSVDADLKQCTKCKADKPLSEFWKNKTNKDGLNRWCKTCSYKDTKGNPKQREHATNWYHKHKSENTKKYLLKYAKARAVKRDLPFSLCESDIVFPDTCPYFGIPFVEGDPKWGYSIDRKIPALGYVPENIEIISCLANKMKWNSSEDELLSFAKGVLERAAKEGS